ncbi:spore germination protein [Cohnella zeiphila]|uniref:Spore germination protein n=1 Tax=Cohnella zeiphila TaxID=2761120 RepID=A0A7X0SLT2_9BACL|nr:spore germination protein [Cohnella zeiphila]MBB6731189.1 spore germination protein [Cohnella zeiphila]
MNSTTGGPSSSDSLSRSLKINLDRILQGTGNSFDIKNRSFHKRGANGRKYAGAVLHADGLADARPLLQAIMGCQPGDEGDNIRGEDDFMTYLRESVLSDGSIEELTSFKRMFALLFSGYSIVLLDGVEKALGVDTIRLNARPVEEPNVQSVVRGPREGFTEVLTWNTSMLRRKIKNPNLWIESRVLGVQTGTMIAIAYVKGIVSEDVLKEVYARLDKIDIDGIFESNYIEEYIQDKQFTTFPTVFNTERPDVVAAQLLEGRVAILVDGTPFALVVPALFTQFFQSPEDYYQRSDFGTLIRMLRFLAFFLAILTPSLYIAVTTFQHELLPTTLLFNLASQREGVPFPAFLEALIMEVTFEILREASVRMPKTIGQSISIVGTLVIGQAAVEAGLVTAGMVIVVSITAISNFVMPAFNMGISARIQRFSLMALGASFGLYGVFLGIILLVVRLCSLKSFGVPYLSPFAPTRYGDQKDSLFRFPFPWMSRRPLSIPTPNRIRQRRIR